MEQQKPSPLLAHSPCRQLGLSSSSSSGEDMSFDGDQPQRQACHHLIFRESDGVAPVERTVDASSHMPYPQSAFGIGTLSSEMHHARAEQEQESQVMDSFEPSSSPFLAITRANPISSYDSSLNYGAIIDDDDDDGDYMASQAHHDDVAIEQQERRYDMSTPPSQAAAAAIDFSPFFRSSPAPVTPREYESDKCCAVGTVVLNADQSVLSHHHQIQLTSAAAGPDDGRRSFSPSGVTEIQNQQQQRGRGAISKVAPSTPTISNVNSFVEDDANHTYEYAPTEQQQRSPFRSRHHHEGDTTPQEYQGQHAAAADRRSHNYNHDQSHNLQYLHHPLINASYTSTTDGSSTVSSHRGGILHHLSLTSSSLLGSSASEAEGRSFDAGHGM